MIREIKFRAWDKKDKRMVEVKLLKISGRILWGIVTPDETTLLRAEFELMQYTGLKDSKGKEIWEGDIVTYLRDTGDKNEEIDYVVELDLGSLDFLIFIDDGQYTCKVIGNIYEHPELLSNT